MDVNALKLSKNVFLTFHYYNGCMLVVTWAYDI